MNTLASDEPAINEFSPIGNRTAHYDVSTSGKRDHTWFQLTRSGMPLPHFLLLLLTIIAAAALTIWAAVATNVPATVMGLLVLAAATIVHFGNISGDDKHHHDER